MEIKGLFTKNGGKVHVHFGSKCITNLWGKYYEITDMDVIAKLNDAVHALHPDKAMANIRDSRSNPNAFGKPYVRAVTPPAHRVNGTTSTTIVTDDMPPAPAPAPESPEAAAKRVRDARQNVVQRLMNFFSEFKFNPAARFVNTLSRQPSPAAMKKYVSGYVRLINNPDSNNIIEKIKSAEFKDIMTDLMANPAENPINTRLILYFGDAGTGKTTQAISEYPDAPVVPCNASMLPDELLRTFDFNDVNGNPVFKPSTLRTCMESGKPVIFDEINLLSFDCLRLLQTITDRKETIDFNGETIHIHPDFKIIGTMNLVVNDQVYNLPEPLVDRASHIKEFELTADDLTDYAFA